MLRNTQHGFTLTELVIVVAIIGILSAIAYPSYTKHMQKVRRTECGAGLLQLASVMERDFSRNRNQYRDVLNTVPPFFTSQCPIDGSNTATYALNIGINPAGSGYTLTATAAAGGPQATDPCGDLTLTNLLQKGQAAGKTVAECW